MSISKFPFKSVKLLTFCMFMQSHYQLHLSPWLNIKGLGTCVIIWLPLSFSASLEATFLIIMLSHNHTACMCHTLYQGVIMHCNENYKLFLLFS